MFLLLESLKISVIPQNHETANLLADIGCGSGKWVIEVAEEFPTSKVFGLDLSPVTREAPKNCEFVIGNLNEGLQFDDDIMDLVQSRYAAKSLY